MISGNKTWDAVYQEWQTDDGQIHAMRTGLLIRCKDCKRCQNSTVLICGKPKEIFYCDGARKMAVAQYDYCSWAEKEIK